MLRPEEIEVCLKAPPGDVDVVIAADLDTFTKVTQATRNQRSLEAQPLSVGNVEGPDHSSRGFSRRSDDAAGEVRPKYLGREPACLLCPCIRSRGAAGYDDGVRGKAGNEAIDRVSVPPAAGADDAICLNVASSGYAGRNRSPLMELLRCMASAVAEPQPDVR